MTGTALKQASDAGSVEHVLVNISFVPVQHRTRGSLLARMLSPSPYRTFTLPQVLQPLAACQAREIKGEHIPRCMLAPAIT
jgi:hypothetical protein